MRLETHKKKLLCQGLQNTYRYYQMNTIVTSCLEYPYVLFYKTPFFFLFNFFLFFVCTLQNLSIKKTGQDSEGYVVGGGGEGGCRVVESVVVFI